MSKGTHRCLSRYNQRRLYKDLAWTWPIISPKEDYREESERAKEAILKYSKIPVRTLLNLGCGGGHVDWVLKKYFSITGIDISRNMLRLARKINPQVAYLRGDMRTVRLDRIFDAVLIHDSINYMLTRNDLTAAFTTGFIHLKPGGILYTFLERYNTVKQHAVNHYTKRKNNIEITFIEHTYDPDPCDTTYESTFVYLVRKNKKLDIYTDHHLGGIFQFQDWLNIAHNVGFKVKQLRFRYSDLPRGQSIPELVCLKPLRL